MYVLQGMYFWAFNNVDAEDIKHSLLLNKNFNKVDVVYFDKLFFGILSNIDLIDKYIFFCVFKKIDTISILELNIIRIAVFELIFCTFIPYKVVLSEALSLSKIFGSTFGYTFVNSILNSVILKIKFF